MKKSLLIFLVVSYTAVHGQNKSAETPYLTKVLDKESINNVDVKTSGGAISVVGAPAAEARVEVYVHGNNSAALTKDAIRQRLEESYDLKISVVNNKLVAEASPKERNLNWKKALSISFKVFVPEKVSTQLRTSGGSISLANLNGSQNFSTSGGSLSVRNLKGEVTGRTSGGSIRAEGSTGNIDLSTSGGSINLSKLSGKIKARTSGGSIKGEGIDGELISHTSGGSINLEDLSCSLETSTSGGHIRASIKQVGSYVKVENSGGDIDLEILSQKGLNLDIRGNRVSTTTLKNFNGRMENDRIEGQLNGGGVPVNIDGGGGRVSFSVKESGSR